MMKRFSRIVLASVLGFVACTGCTKRAAPQSSSVILSFAVGQAETRAAAELADGSEIHFVSANEPDLFIAIANYSGEIVARYPAVVENESECLEANDAQATVRFNKITNPGSYTVYAVANKTGLWGMNSTLESASTVSDLEALFFNVSPSTPNPDDDEVMPLSAVGTLMVKESLTGQADLDLLRCVAKVGFRFKNDTGAVLNLSNCIVTIHQINPTQGYLFEHTPDATGDAGDLSLNRSTITIPKDSSSDMYEMSTVYPSIAPSQAVGSRYLCDISFSLGGDTKEFTNLPIHDSMSQDIQALKRNQYLQIETRISRGLNISFNFEVMDWTPHTEDVLFH